MEKMYIVKAIRRFLDDPATSRYQEGYLDALQTVYLDLWGDANLRRLAADDDLDWRALCRAEGAS